MAVNKQYQSKIESVILGVLAEEWASNGHKLTNRLIDNTDIVFESKKIGASIKVLMFQYGVAMNKGVKASKIPYNPRKRGQGKGGTSLYIQGLMDYVARRMGKSKGSKENKSIAFAIAASHKKKGMPLRTRGQGTGWLDDSADKLTKDISDLTLEFLSKELRVIINVI